MSTNERHEEDFHDDYEDHEASGSDYYGVAPGIGGVLLGVALIVFMFALADGFS